MLHMRHATFSWQQQHKTATGQARAAAAAIYRCYRKGKFQRCHQCDSSKRNLLRGTDLIRLATKFLKLTTGGVAVYLLEITDQLESLFISLFIQFSFIYFWHWSIPARTRSHCPFQLCCQLHLERSHIGGRNKFTAQFGIQKWEMLRLWSKWAQLSRKTPGISKTNPS